MSVSFRVNIHGVCGKATGSGVFTPGGGIVIIDPPESRGLGPLRAEVAELADA